MRSYDDPAAGHVAVRLARFVFAERTAHLIEDCRRLIWLVHRHRYTRR